MRPGAENEGVAQVWTGDDNWEKGYAEAETIRTTGAGEQDRKSQKKGWVRCMCKQLGFLANGYWSQAGRKCQSSFEAQH